MPLVAMAEDDRGIDPVAQWNRKVAVDPDRAARVQAEGRFRVRQLRAADFGSEPDSVVGAVAVDFRVQSRPTAILRNQAGSQKTLRELSARHGAANANV